MKTRILAIAPYPGLKETINSVVAGRDDIEIRVEVGDLEKGLSIAKKYENSFDVIISRGGTGELIQKYCETPVLNISITVYDVLCAIKSAVSTERNLAVVGYSYITDCARELCNILQYSIKTVTIDHDADVKSILSELSEEGIDTLVCDMYVSTVAKEVGMQAILVLSGSQSIKQVMEQAVQLAKSFNHVRGQREVLKMLCSESNKDALVFREDGRLWFSTLEEMQEEALIAKLKPYIDSFLRGERSSIDIMEDNKLHVFASENLGTSEDNCVIVTHICKEVFTYDDDIIGVSLFNSDTLKDADMDTGISVSNRGRRNNIESYAKLEEPVFIVGENGTEKVQIASLIYTSSKYESNHYYIVNCDSVTSKDVKQLLTRSDSILLDVHSVIFFRNMDCLNEHDLQMILEYLVQSRVWRSNKLIFSFDSGNSECEKKLQLCLQEIPGLLIKLEPLRNRSDEIPGFSVIYLNQMNREQGKEIVGFELGAMMLLKEYTWPGNFRQLRRIIKEAAALTEGSYISIETVRSLLDNEELCCLIPKNENSITIRIDRPLADINKEIVSRVLEMNGMNKTKTAEMLNIGRSTIWRMIN